MAAPFIRRMRKSMSCILICLSIVSLLLLLAMALFTVYCNYNDADRRRRDVWFNGHRRPFAAPGLRLTQGLRSNGNSTVGGSGSGNVDPMGSSLHPLNGELLLLGDSKRFHPDIRAVHLDLKGGTPKLFYLKQLFQLIQEAGGNALLIEYEDMFPYWHPIVNASALNAFTPQEIRELLSMAKQHQLEVIPLVQTFGHMEHVLKLEEFSHLREVFTYPQTICPSRDESMLLIQTMLDQVMQLHPDARFFHIGCDEVYHLAQCSKCKERLKKSGALPSIKSRKDFHSEVAGPHTLYLEQVRKVASYLKNKYQVQPIIWDDMLRSIPARELIASGITTDNLIEPMIWVYVENIDQFIQPETWRTYSNLFPYLWTASAFKGAFGGRSFMPNLLRHYKNHVAWMQVMSRESGAQGHGKAARFRGIALTGWSRYDHFAVLCELLPVAVPSLVLNLVTVSNAQNTNESLRFRRAQQLLNCHNLSSSLLRLDMSQLEQDPFQFDLRKCHFSGSEVFGVVSALHHFKAEVEALDTTSRENQGWLTSYNIQHNYSSPWRLIEAVGSHAYLEKALKEYAANVSRALQFIFDNSTVQEWIEQNIDPLQKKTERLLQVVGNLTARQTWPRRPIP